MSDFNIRKYLAEAEKLSYDDFTANQKPRGKFKPNLDPVDCPDCGGLGIKTKATHGPEAEAPCSTCGGKGEIFEDYGDYEDYNDNKDEFEPAVNMCPACQGEGCDECGGEGAIHEDEDGLQVLNKDGDEFIDKNPGYNHDKYHSDPATEFGDLEEGNADEMAREVAQDMVDGGMAATSDQNFNDLYDVYMERYREGWGWPDQFREDVRAAYKAILKAQTQERGGHFTHDHRSESAELDKMVENAGMAVETKKQGKAPSAQLKGKETIKNKGVKTYDEPHPASGQLVGESELTEEPGDWDHGYNYEGPQGDDDEFQRGWDDSKEAKLDDDPWGIGEGEMDPYGGGQELDADDPFGDRMDMDFEPGEDIGAKYRQSPDNPYGTEGNGYDDAQLDKYDTEHGLEDPFGLEEDLLAEYGDYDDWDEDEEDMYGEPEEDPQGPFITGTYTEQSYWNKTGKFNAESDKLEDLIPAQGVVDDEENNPALENFRIMGNVYYDVHNNGGYDEGYGQRYDELIQVSGWDSNGTYSYQDLEDLIDTVVHDAWQEQTAKGVVENFSGAFASGPMVQEDDDDLIGMGDTDMGTDVLVNPGDLVSVDSSLGGEATVVAQREGYIVVNLPKGGMKLLRDDQWWIDDEDGFGGDDGYVDVEGGYEEPDELAFEASGAGQFQLRRTFDGGKTWAHIGDTHDDIESAEKDRLGQLKYIGSGRSSRTQVKIVKVGTGYPDWSMMEDQAAVMPQHSQDDRQDPLFREGYKILPPMDPKYVERDGLEGPFTTRSGKVVYYDPKAGKYYDPDTDIYMSSDEYAEYDRDSDMIYPQYSAGNTDTPRRERGRMDEGPGMMKKFAKHMKRGMGNWDGNVGHNYPADSSEPFNIMDRIRNYSTEELKDYMEQHKGHKPSSWSDTFVKLAKRELRRRGERDYEKYMGDESQVSEFTQEQRLLKHFNTSYGQSNSLRADYDDKAGRFSVRAHGDNHAGKMDGDEIWSGSADEFGSKYNVKNRYGIEEEKKTWTTRGIELPGKFRSRYDRIAIGSDPKTAPAIRGADARIANRKGVKEVWMPARNDRNFRDPSDRMKQKMHQELGHENEWNNYAIFIDGKHWKTVKNEGHAKAIVRTLVGKGKKAEYKFGAYPMNENWEDTGSKKFKKAIKKHDGQIRKDEKDYEKAIKKHDAHLRKEKGANGEDLEEGMSPNFMHRWDAARLKRFIAQDGPDKGAIDRAKKLLKKKGGGEIDEAKWDYKDKDKNKGAGFSKGGDGGQKNRKNRKAFRKAEKAKKHQAMMRGEKWAQEPVEEGNFWGRDDMVKWARDDEKKRGMVRLRKTENGSTTGISTSDPKKIAHYKANGYEVVDEGTSTHKKGPKNKGGGYNKPGSVKQKKAAAKTGRQADKKAIASEGSAHDESWLPKTWPHKKRMEEDVSDGDKLVDLARSKTAIPVTVKGVNVELIVKRRSLKIGKDKPGMPVFDVFIQGGGKKQAISRTNGAEETIQGVIARVNQHGPAKISFVEQEYDMSEMESGFGSALSEIETASDQLAQNREEPALGDTVAPEVDSDAELAGMQQIMKNMLNEPDQDMEDAIQNMAMANTDPNDAALGTDEVEQLQQLLGLLK